ncbi:hypothetical protein B5G52_09975 [Pseudoalteromonas sp. A601]|nr:hypothetical protein B5G52_09975 [Pseudoalteromonas sp. A601]
MILTIEPLLFAINALPKSLLIPTETRILRWFGYKFGRISMLITSLRNNDIPKLAGPTIEP